MKIYYFKMVFPKTTQISNYLVSEKLLTCSATRLGDFWNFPLTYFSFKVAQIFGDFWAILINNHFLIITAMDRYILGNVKHIWANFYSYYLVTLLTRPIHFPDWSGHSEIRRPPEEGFLLGREPRLVDQQRPGGQGLPLNSLEDLALMIMPNDHTHFIKGSS